MAFSIASSSSSSPSAISATSYSRSSDLEAPQIGSMRLWDRPAIVSLSQRGCALKPVNAEFKWNDSIVPLAAAIVEPEEAVKIEVENYEQLAEELENSSPLEIMDKALEKFGNDICHGPYNLSPIPCGLSSPNELSQPSTPTSAENNGT